MTDIETTYNDDSSYSDACIIVEKARKEAYYAINIALTQRNWQLGERIA